MSVGIVDFLEVISIDKEDRKRGSVAAVFLELILEFIHNGSAIEKASQCIGLGKAVEETVLFNDINDEYDNDKT